MAAGTAVRSLEAAGVSECNHENNLLERMVTFVVRLWCSQKKLLVAKRLNQHTVHGSVHGSGCYRTKKKLTYLDCDWIVCAAFHCRSAVKFVLAYETATAVFAVRFSSSC